MELSIIYDKLRFEEKKLYDDAIKKGIKTRLVDAKSISISTEINNNEYLGDVFFQRCLSHFRGLYITSCIEFLGYPIINTYEVTDICGNKLRTSLLLTKSKVASPKTYFSFNSESFKSLIEKIGFPFVIKPLIGSWGRGVFPVKDDEVANMLIENREENDTPFSRIYYVQEMIDRPPRDIRCILAGEQIITAVYRYSADNEWRTNVARGGHTALAPITHELEDIVIQASKAVGGGILGVDVMEDKNRGFVVHEINSNVEFRGASQVTQTNIASSMIDYVTQSFKK
ncbi:MAG: lysine biosynthesis protein LysX [Nitrososphaeraceae archaeon]